MLNLNKRYIGIIENGKMAELKHMVETKELNENQISCFIKVCNYLDNNR